MTSAAERGYGEYVNDTFINCTCDHLSSFAVILNDAEAEVKILISFFLSVFRYVVDGLVAVLCFKCDLIHNNSPEHFINDNFHR